MDHEQDSILPVGFKLHWYEIIRVLGIGGFGITYAARDTTLTQDVAVKEFFPRNIAVRDADHSVRAAGEHRRNDFAWGLTRFLDEAHTLAAFSHPNIVRVFSAFEMSGTAYMVMHLEHGQPITAAKDAGKLAGEDALLQILAPLLDGIEMVHESGFIHRDIKPDNILLRADGTPVLVDFGAARSIRESSAREITSLVSRGFAPYEQYSTEGEGRRQGPWGDIYGLAAVLYRLVTGVAPIDSVKRGMLILETDKDPLRPASELCAGQYSAEFLTAIDAGLAFRLEERPLAIASWRSMFPWRQAPTAPITELYRPDNPADHTASVNSEATAAPGRDDTTTRPTATTMPPAPVVAVPEFATFKVLVVDDDRFERKLALNILERLGVAEVSVAADGREGLALLASADDDFDIVICDLRMPDIDGIEFIRGIGNTAARPSIVFSSGVEASILEAAENFAVNTGLRVLGTTTKPLRPQTLSGMLQRELDSTASLSSGVIVSPRHSVTLQEVTAGLNTGSLAMYFQPKVSTATRKVVGFEALARWIHPEYGVLGPGAFLHVIEKNGLEDEFTRAVVRTALHHVAGWLAEGLDIALSINIEAANLIDLEFPNFVVEQAVTQGIQPRQIALELTESGVARDAMAAMEILTRLRLNDITLSIDDFGTGYASLDKLQYLPFTELKIDRVFVNGASRNRNTRALLASAAELGRKLNLHIVAEGVENAEDWNIVTDLGCHAVQGYLIAKPMPADEVAPWLSNWDPVRFSAG